MSNIFKIDKGLNINVKGEADKVYASVRNTNKYVVKPTDFYGITPKLLVSIGDKVKSGTPLFHDKYNKDIKFCSPASGEVTEINRGEKRRILEIVLLSNSEEIIYEDFKIDNSSDFSREEIIKNMLNGGLWPFVRQRPYDIIANPNDIPKAIFISTFNTAPLTIDNDFALYGMDELFQKGIDYVSKLTSGKTHLNIDGNINSSKVFSNVKGVQLNKFSGPHPSGNVGVQIHHIDPINKGDVVWYLQPQDIISIARFFTEGKYDISRIIALSGSQVIKPRYYRLVSGSSVHNLLIDNLKKGTNRIISGDVLTGKKIDIDGSLGFYDTTITVIEEGDNQEFLGWILPGFDKLSASRAFFSWLQPKRRYELNANMHGEERAYVVSGQYEKVFPMDIYPTQLVKAIMIEDIELMESLGIYEVAPEDFALCEFVCTSKIEVQALLRYGLDLVRKENN
jgi:Na+-transporting NADH:ubiquinone oxidoreductase subunit A